MAAKSASLYVRLNPQTKAKAEQIMNKLGVSPSTVVNMLYKQIILQGGIPFSVKLPKNPVEANPNSQEFAQQLHQRYLTASDKNSIPLNELGAEYKARYHISDKNKGE